MEEVTQNCDTITVMRDGVSVATKPVKEYSMEQIVRDMVGRSITEFYPDRRNKPGEVLLEVKNFEDVYKRQGSLCLRLFRCHRAVP